MTEPVRILTGDCIASMRTLPDASVNCCVTSPPYLGLRDYGHDGQIGLEPTPDAYVAKMVEVFREVRRVLRDDGTCWLNLGDSYAANGGAHGGRDDNQTGVGAKRTHDAGGGDQARRKVPGQLKPKDLIGIPWRVAFALQADGWWLRQDIIWAKPNPMPESVTDRCTKAHEYLFLLAKRERYYFDAKAITEPFADHRMGNPGGGGQYSIGSGRNDSGALKTGLWNEDGLVKGRNRRSVWTVSTKPYKGAHFATFPPDLIEPCILAGCPIGGTVLDPFGGSGTTGQVAMHHHRKAILCELNPDYVTLIRQRLAEPMLPLTFDEVKPDAWTEAERKRRRVETFAERGNTTNKETA